MTTSYLLWSYPRPKVVPNLERHNKKIREENAAYFDMSTEEREVLRIKDALDKRLIQFKANVDSFKTMEAENNKNRIAAATRKGILLIDKECLLTFPLDDPRTSPTVRSNYVKQGELLALYNEIAREEEREQELSSPSKETLPTSQSKSRLVEMPEEEYRDMKSNNLEILKSLYGEVPKDFCTQSDTQLCTECQHFTIGDCQ